MLDIAEADIGGAKVRRTFTRGDVRHRAGEILEAEVVLSIAKANRRALIDANYIDIYPKAPVVPGELFIVAVSKDRFNVIEGQTINEKPLTRDQADELVRQRRAP